MTSLPLLCGGATALTVEVLEGDSGLCAEATLNFVDALGEKPKMDAQERFFGRSDDASIDGRSEADLIDVSDDSILAGSLEEALSSL